VTITPDDARRLVASLEVARDAVRRLENALVCAGIMERSGDRAESIEAAIDEPDWRGMAEQATKDLHALEDAFAAGEPPIGPGHCFASWSSPANTMRWIDQAVRDHPKP